MSHQAQYVPYDPLLDPPRFPPNTDFGEPSPRGSPLIFSQNDAYNQYRTSEYGSIAPLKGEDGPYQSAPPSRIDLNNYHDDPSQYRDYPPAGHYTDKQQLYAAPRTKTKRKGLIWIIVIILLILAAVIGFSLYWFVFRKKSNSNSNSNGRGPTGQSNGNGNTADNSLITTGGDGSIVTKEDGTTFVYHNTFDGYWVFDPANPLNNSARAQSYSPALNEPWKWGVDRIYGVNLGGWLVLEPFITPALYEQFYPEVVDEWTLCEHLMGRDGNLNAIEEHYKTFIVEEDFAAIAAAGLNWVRIPLPFYAIEKFEGEPYLDRVSWTYFLKAIQWARKYGLRINLDLHSAPGSQNSWNHSGKLASKGFLAGTMGIANAQRTLNYIRIITEFISQPEYVNVVPLFGILNEPYAGTSGFILDSAIKSFYAEVYRMIRGITGVGEGNGPVISIGNAFSPATGWGDFLPGADRLAMDFHPYLVFTDQPRGTPDEIASLPCSTWAKDFANISTGFGINTAGEWSFAINDCGLYTNDVLKGSRYEGLFTPGTWPVIGSCDQWNDYTTWPAGTQEALYKLGLAHMDALQNWFFWTWRIGEALSGKIENPFWSYKLGLEQGWAPTDPRVADGQCASMGAPANTFSGPFQPWQTGGVGAGDVPALDQHPWPPTAIASISAAQITRLPQYTQTGDILTLPLPTFTQPGTTSTINVGNGWANAADIVPLYTPIAGCSYPDPWNAGTAIPAACAAALKRSENEDIPLATPTPAPR